MYVPQVVDYINAVLSSRLSAPQFQRGRYFSIAKQVLRKGKNDTPFVVIFDNDGNDISDLINDKYPFVVYHRMTGISFSALEQNQKNSFGDGTNVKGLVMNMVAVVYGDRKTLRMTNEELSALMYIYFPTEMPASIKAVLTGVEQLTFNPSATNNVSAQVSQTEGITVEIENILFAINYQIVEIINTNCFGGCDFSFDTNNICFELCASQAGTVQSITFLTEDGKTAYDIDAIEGKKITFVLFGNMVLIGVDPNVANPQFTKPQAGKTITFIDPAFPITAGIEVTLGYK